MLHIVSVLTFLSPTPPLKKSVKQLSMLSNVVKIKTLKHDIRNNCQFQKQVTF